MIRHDGTEIVACPRLHNQREAKVVGREVMKMRYQTACDFGYAAGRSERGARINCDMKLFRHDPNFP